MVQLIPCNLRFFYQRFLSQKWLSVEKMYPLFSRNISGWRCLLSFNLIGDWKVCVHTAYPILRKNRVPIQAKTHGRGWAKLVCFIEAGNSVWGCLKMFFFSHILNYVNIHVMLVNKQYCSRSLVSGVYADFLLVLLMDYIFLFTTRFFMLFLFL